MLTHIQQPIKRISEKLFKTVLDSTTEHHLLLNYI